MSATSGSRATSFRQPATTTPRPQKDPESEEDTDNVSVIVGSVMGVFVVVVIVIAAVLYALKRYKRPIRSVFTDEVSMETWKYGAGPRVYDDEKCEKS